MSIGLKGCMKHYKGCYFHRKIKMLMRELKYTWQRAWRGYDDRDVWSMNTQFIDRYLEILKSYKKNHHCLFNVPKEHKDKYDKLFLNEEETNAIIDTMICHLEMMDEDNAEKVLYGKNVYDDDYEIPENYPERMKHISEVMENNKNAFMKLFSLFFWDLWD